MGNDVVVTLRLALARFAESLAHFLPRILAALAIFVVGVLLTALLRAVTRRLLKWLRFDQLVERVGAGQVLTKIGAKPPHHLLGTAVYWLTWIAVVLAMLRALGLTAAEVLLSDFIRFLPDLAAAIVVVVLGFLLSGLAWRASLLAAVNARMQSAKLVGAMVRGLVLVGTLAMAFEQIGVGRGVMHTAFALVFGAIMLAVAIAFGLGGRHAARRYLEERLLARGRGEEDGPSHL